VRVEYVAHTVKHTLSLSFSLSVSFPVTCVFICPVYMCTLHCGVSLVLSCGAVHLTSDLFMVFACFFFFLFWSGNNFLFTFLVYYVNWVLSCLACWSPADVSFKYNLCDIGRHGQQLQAPLILLS